MFKQYVLFNSDIEWIFFSKRIYVHSNSLVIRFFSDIKKWHSNGMYELEHFQALLRRVLLYICIYIYIYIYLRFCEISLKRFDSLTAKKCSKLRYKCHITKNTSVSHNSLNTALRLRFGYSYVSYDHSRELIIGEHLNQLVNAMIRAASY